MISTEFGIIDNIEDTVMNGVSFDLEKYHCAAIDDDIYINDWWDRLSLLKTFFQSLERPSFGLARWGITIIPPESLPDFQNIVISDKRINSDENLVVLSEKIGQAIKENKYMIHFGV